jgi:arylsulfatase A-like enzyme
MYIRLTAYRPGLLAACLGIFVFGFLYASPVFAAKPNVILILTDDQGYGDLSSHGNPILKTPHMDTLHAESVRLTNFHVDPTCAPTRSALMTGNYSHRVGVWHTIMGRNHLRADQTTMANFFAQNGYETALFGKWHLGTNYPYRPIDRGFQKWLGQGDGGTGTGPDYWGNDRVNDTYIRDGKNEQIDGWAPDVFYDEAIRFIRKKHEQPFFLYLPTYVPHGPHPVPDKAWTKPYDDKVPTKAAYFFASIAHVDRNIGRLRESLEEAGIADNTIVIFMTDNGGTGGVQIFNAGMRGQKGSEYEGGHRVPCFIHWPAGKLNKPLDVNRLTAHIDILPTLMDLCGLKASNEAFDGVSLKPLLYQAETEFPARTLFVESQRILMPEKWRKSAVMTQRWRLVNGSELYDIQADPGQTHNISDSHTDEVDQLRKAYEEEFWASVTAQDDQFAQPIVGTKSQEEINLQTHDAFTLNQEDALPWNQGHVMNGILAFNYWRIKIVRERTYRFEVRRWPREANTAISGVYTFTKEPDAWNYGNPVTGTIYGGKGRALPVSKIQLRVGDQVRIQNVRPGQRYCEFNLKLPEGSSKVEAFMLDADGEAMGSAYYVYVKPTDDVI